MTCPMCGKFFTHGPCFYPGTKTIVCSDYYPFECAGCHTTTKQAWIVDKAKEWCFPCHDKRRMREERRFGEPGGGQLFQTPEDRRKAHLQKQLALRYKK